MIIDISKVRIFIRSGSTDLRKASNGLTVIIQEEMKMLLAGIDFFKEHKELYYKKVI